jgi:excisionase family DNA binding protein
MPEPLLKPEDVRKRLNVGLSTVYRLAAQGTLPAVKIPGTALVRFNAERVEALLRQWGTAGRRQRNRAAG